MIFKGYLFGVLYGLLCLALSLTVYKLGVPKKYTRKIVHILVGFEWVILNYFLGAGIHFFAVCIIFLALLIVEYRFKLMPMISSEGDNSPGTVYYAVAMSIVALVMCFNPNVMMPFGIGVFCTSVGDGLAAIFGQILRKYNPKIVGSKTLFGTVFCFIGCLVSILVLKHFYNLQVNLWQILYISILVVAIELVSTKGLDNIFITLSATFTAYGFMFIESFVNYLLPIIITPIILYVVLEKKILTRAGAAFAVILDAAVSISLGNFGFLILILFLSISVIVDRAKKKKKNYTDENKKGSCRDVFQVAANGICGLICSVLFIIWRNPIFIVGYVASFAEALSDTVSSGIGVFAKKTVSILTFKKCEPGISGGISLIGTLSALLASLFLSFVPVLFGIFNLNTFLICFICSFAGGIVDSLLGAVVQVKYRCAVCNKITEKSSHCHENTVYYRGIKFINNDVVNIASCIFSTVISIFIAYLLV